MVESSVKRYRDRLKYYLQCFQVCCRLSGIELLPIFSLKYATAHIDVLILILRDFIANLCLPKLCPLIEDLF